jgi:phosphohistidine phosphatase
MRIYLFRHGEALSKGEPSVSSDAERPLTQDGIKHTRQAAEGLKALDIAFDCVFTSPWVRARQTADIAAAVWGLQPKVEEMPELAGDRRVQEVLAALAKHAGLEHVVLVGHNPLLGEVAAYLLSLATAMTVDLKKSGVCAVEVQRVPPRSPGTLLWMMTAKQLRALRSGK